MAAENWLGAGWFRLAGKSLYSQLYLFFFLHQILPGVLPSNIPKEITDSDSIELTTNYHNSSLGSKFSVWLLSFTIQCVVIVIVLC